MWTRRPSAPVMVRAALQAGVEAGVTASVRPAARARPNPAPRDSTHTDLSREHRLYADCARYKARGLRLTTSHDLHLVKGASAFVPALLTAETAAPHRAARLRHMVLEATYLCVDNSDYMRNGDFAPSRMEAQQDAVNLLAGAKTQVRAALRSAAAPLWQLPSLAEVSREPHLWVARARCKPHGRESG